MKDVQKTASKHSRRSAGPIFAVSAAWLLNLCVLSAAWAQAAADESIYFDTAASSGALLGGRSTAPVSGFECASTISASPSADVQVVRDSGPSTNRIDLVFLGDGYPQSELGVYAGRVAELAANTLAQTPLYEYSSYFNVHRVDVVSQQSGIDHDPLYGSLRDTALDSQFWCQGTSGSLCTGVAKAWEYAALARDFDQIVVLANSGRSGGAAYPFSDLSVISAGQPQAADSIVHQFGHSFADLADEYETGSWPVYTGFEPAEPNVSAQTQAAMAAQQLKWHRWLGVDSGPAFGGVIGAYEGAMGHQSAIFRPTLDSKMRTLSAPFNSPSVEAILMQIYRTVSPIDSATAADAALTGSDTISVTPLRPLNHSLSIQWSVNGSPVQGATGETFRPNDYPFADGTYSVSVSVIDNTPWVKDEAFRTQYMSATRSWSVAIDQNAPVILTQPKDQSVNVGQGAVFSVTAQGEDLRYQWYKNATAIAQANSASYLTPAAAKPDSGAVYHVVVSNVAGSVRSADATLTVLNRAPTLSPIGDQTLVRDASMTIQLTASDADGDALSFTAEVDSAGTTLGATASVDALGQLNVTAGRSLGAFEVLATVTDGSQSASRVVRFSVANQLPRLGAIPAQNIPWRNGSVTVTLAASDPDGDPLTLNAELVPADSAPITLNLSGSELMIDPADEFLGQAAVRVTVSDGIASTAQTFTVTAYDNAPSIGGLANQSMHWREGSLSFNIPAADIDGDPLTYLARLADGVEADVDVSVVGSTVTVDPPDDYLGVFGLMVGVTDGMRTTERSLLVTVYNSTPSLAVIPNQRMHYKRDWVEVALSSADSDGDELTYEARVTPGSSAQVELTFNENESFLRIDPAEGFLGVFSVEVSVSDGNLRAARTFAVDVYNSIPLLNKIPDQRMHWIKDDTRVLALSAVQTDGEDLTYSAEVLTRLSPAPVVTVDGSELTIDPPDRFLGSFTVRVTVSDGMESSTGSFTVTGYNTPPELEPICDRSIHWNETPYQLPLTASDPDDEPLTYSAFVERFTLAYDLDRIYNFYQPESGWNYNQLGLQEKYLLGTKNGNSLWLMLLPAGDLYEFNGSVTGSVLVGKLPESFHRDPALLIDAPEPSPQPDVNIAVSENIVTITPAPLYSGTFLMRARANDGQLFDEETFLVTVFDSRLRIAPISTLRMHWTERERTVVLNAEDEDGTAPASAISYTAVFADTAAAYSLDQSHDFQSGIQRAGYTQDNAAGRNERYIVGTRRTGQQYLYAMLPTGEIFSCSGSISAGDIDSSTLLGRLNPVYYRNLDLLVDVPPPVAPPVELSVSGQELTIRPQVGFTGKSLMTVHASNGGGSDSYTLVLDIYNTEPALPDVQPVSISWTEDYRALNVVPSDADAEDAQNLSLSAHIGSVWHQIKKLEQYNLAVDLEDLRENESGWREKHLKGDYDGQPADIVILPSNFLYVWRGTAASSPLLAKLPAGYYDNPEILNAPVNPGDEVPEIGLALQGNRITIDPPSGYTGGFLLYIQTTDGNRAYDAHVSVAVINSAPSLAVVPAQVLHWRSDKLDLTLSGNDRDGDPLEYSAALDSTTSNAPVELGLSGNVLTVNPAAGFVGLFGVVASVRDLSQTASRTFSVNVYDNAPVLTPVGPKSMGWKEDQLNLSLAGSDPDAADEPYLEFGASLGTAADRAYRLREQFQLRAANPSFGFNARGYGEKYLDGQADGAPASFVVLPNGALYRFSGSFPLGRALANFPTTYYENPGLILSAQAGPVLPDVQVSLVGNRLAIDPRTSGFTGSFPVTVDVTDGWRYTSETFTVTVANRPPTLSAIADIQRHWRLGALSLELNASDADGDVLSYSASVTGVANANASVSGNILTIEPPEKFIGEIPVRVTVSDGSSSDTKSFKVRYLNNAPGLGAIGTQQIHWSASSRTITLAGGDTDNDPLTYRAVVSSNLSGGSVAVNGNSLTITPSGNGQTFSVTATVTDGIEEASRTFQVSITDAAPVISAIPAQTVSWRTQALSVALRATDADGDPITFTAKLSEGSDFPARFNVSGSTLTVTLTQGMLGSFSADVSASDGYRKSTTTLMVIVKNNAPTLLPLPDQIINSDVPGVTVGLEGADADNDPLTYSASVLSTDQLAYELDQSNNFELRYGDYGYNRLGNLEKYFQGTKNLAGAVFNYVIFPNGRLYEWSGQLTTSKYLATLPADYYTNPSRLFNVAPASAPEAPAAVTVSGSSISIAPRAGFLGRFYIRAAVSDTKASASAIFGVLVQAPAPVAGGGGSGPDGCYTSTKVHSADYNPSKATAFVAQARIGDGTMAAGNRTYELALGRSVHGPFAAGESADYRWNSGQRTSFSLTFDKDTGSVNLTVGGATVSHHVSDSLQLTDLFVRTVSTHDAANISVDQLKLNGESISDIVGASLSRGRANVLQITAPNALAGKFTLEGSMLMDFSSGPNSAKDSQTALEVSAAHVSAHGEGCGSDDGSRKITVCHDIYGGHPHTISISRSALEMHLAHGDVIGECPGNPDDPGDGTRTCEEKHIIQSPNYTLWNSFLGMTNILELTNSGMTDLPVKISFFSIQGLLLHEVTLPVPALNQYDVIINDFPRFIRDSYGVIKLEFSGALDGRMMYYRPSADGAGYDFAFGIPLADANFGTTAVSFNTYQPSQKPEEMNNLVANWLSIVNLDSQEQGYTVYTYDHLGKLVLRREIAVAPFGRADVDGGHDLAGPNVVGFHKIVAHNVTAEYIAQLTRFGGDVPAGFAPSKYKFAFPLSAKLGQSDPVFLPVSNRFNELNWIEVVNILDKAVEVSVNYYAMDGRLLDSADALVQPNAQLHFYATEHLLPGETGYAEVVPREAYSIIAQSMGYLREPATSSVTAVYGSQARRAVPCVQSGSYNLYLGMQNWLLVANTTNDTIGCKVQITGPELMSEKTLTLAPRASVYLPVHVPATFGARADSYGLVAVYPEDPSLRLFAEVMRVRFRADGSPDFAAPTPVR